MNATSRNVILVLFILGMGAIVVPAQQRTTPPRAGTMPAPAPAGAGTATNALGPRIRFATPVYDFAKVKSGDPVEYTYVFTNTGDQVLEVSAVHPQCGCTTAGQWTRKVEPGQTGDIPVRYNSAGYRSGPIIKTITVTSNDKTHPVTLLQLKGTVWKPIDYIPMYPALNVPPDATNGSLVVRLINHLPEPLTLSPPVSNNRALAATLTAAAGTNQAGREFQLKLSTVPPLPSGTVQVQISLKTSSTNVPLITIPVWLTVQPAIMVMPQQINLPQGPLPTRATPACTIQNISTNRLVLSDAAVNVPGVEVKLNEMQPGRTFVATLAFPQGFEVPAGQQAVFTAKSNNPLFPLIKVPIIQPARPITRPPLRPVPAPANAATPPKPFPGRNIPAPPLPPSAAR